ncbi:tail completion protein gp17 [Thermogutta sp.]|jgi:hypothetical protein|uniref:tail completion protein gp17 n=1 Tax=Thermogutta sp. TaxID=1962930 RepID=UPI0032205414
MLRLEHALYTQWSEDATLAGLIPPQNVWTGCQSPPRLPGACIRCLAEERAWLTAKSEWADRVHIQVTLWVESFDHLRKSMDAVRRVYHGTSLDLGDGGRIVRISYRRMAVEDQEPSVWRGTVEFDALTLRPVLTT